LADKQIHEIKPVKFGGSPTDPANKIPLSRPDHAKLTVWWNRLLKELKDFESGK
jgi:toxin YxiD